MVFARQKQLHPELLITHMTIMKTENVLTTEANEVKSQNKPLTHFNPLAFLPSILFGAVTD